MSDALWTRVAAIAEAHPDREAIVSGDVRYTFGQLFTRAARLAAGLFAFGVRPGDRVAYLAQNRPEYVELLLATARLGASLVPLNTRLGTDDFAAVLRRSGAKVLIFGESFRKHDYVALVSGVLGGTDVNSGRRLPEFPELERLVLLDSSKALGLPTYGDLIRSGERETPPSHRDADTVSLMLFTSGSSGLPKPVQLGQGQLVRNMTRVSERMGIRPDDRILSYLPYFHVYGGVITTLTALLNGAAIVMLGAYDADESLEVASRERCTVVYGIAPTFNAWLDHPRFGTFDLSSIRTGVCSAGLPAMSATARRVRQALVPMHSLFGMTETHGVATLTRKGDSEHQATSSAGIALPAAEIAVFRPGTSLRCEPQEEGEVRIRGDMITRGYFRLPDETRRAINEDGWLHTGDRGHLDAQGYLYISGRLDERIRCGGENIDPREVERFLISHPSVGQCQVVGVPDARLGEVPVAFIITKARTDVDAEAEIKAFCRARIADFKIPRRVFFVDEFPGWMHKVQRYKLRDEAIKRMQSS